MAAAAVDVVVNGGEVCFSRVDDSKMAGTRALINNMVTGVSEGYTRKLELVGVGHRAALSSPAAT